MENEKTFRDVATEVSIELLEKSREMEAGTEKHDWTDKAYLAPILEAIGQTGE